MSFARPFFILSLFLSLSFAAQAFDVPRLTGPVVDEAGLLNPGTSQKISALLQEAHRNNGPQIQVLVLSSLQDLTIEEAAIKVFDVWKLGGEKEDNGVLFLIAPKEKKLRIEVGRGLEGDIPDAYAKRIVSDIVLPYFKSGDFDMGIYQGVMGILHYAKSPLANEQDAPAVKEEAPKKKGSGSSPFLLLIVFGIWLIIFFLNPSLALALLFSGRGGRGGGSGGGGGWSGGGGSSSGGGASGGW